MSTLNLMQRLNAVMKSVGYVQKDKNVDKRYNVATYDQVIAVVRPYLVEHGVVVMTRQIGPGTSVPTGQVSTNGAAARLYTAMYEIDFINADAPEDRFTVPMEAQAIDTGDKAPGKAQTYATKAAIKKALSLETGDDEESRFAPDDTSGDTEPAPRVQQPRAKDATSNGDKPAASGKLVSAGQIAFLKRKLLAADRAEEALLKHLNLDTLDKLTEEGFAQATAWLKQAA